MTRKIDVSLISGNGGIGGQLLGANAGNVSFQNVYTSNVIESGNTTSGNVYFSNARAIGALIAGDNITIAANGRISSTAAGGGAASSVTAANVIGLNTANVNEFGGNLYYTNARVYSNVIALLPTLAGDNITIAANGRISSTASGGVSQASLTTANVNEFGSNLYYTNARVYSNVVSLLATYTGNVNAGNLSIQGGSGGTIGGANLISTNIISALTWTGLYAANVVGLTTANVAETASGLYYTNARTRSTLSAGTGVGYDTSTGVISIGQNVSTTANVTFGALNVTGVTNFYGNVITHASNNLSISDNMIYLNAGSESSNPDLGISGNYNDGVYHHAGFFRDASDSGTWKVFENYSPEPDANIFIDTSHATFRLANLAATTFIGNVSGTVGSIANFSTSNLTEGNNLYYTNNRVLSNVQAYLTANPQGSSSTYANANVAAYLNTYTGNISAGNIIANGFVSASASAGLITSSGNITMTAAGAVNINSTNVIASGNVIANTFISTGAGSAALSSTGNVTITATGIVTLNGTSIIVNGPLTANSYSGISTANVTETASGLYYTNARVYSNILALLPTLAGNNIIIAANGQISANLAAAGGGAASSVLATGVIGLNTANVSESTSNLYYTNARVASNVLALMPSLAGNNIIIAANGQISANLLAATVNVNSVTGNLSVTGNVIANGFVSASASAGLITSTGNITMTALGAVNINSTNVIASGNIIANTFISTGTGAAVLASTGNVSITGVGNITLNSSNVVASGNVVASKFFGDGSSLTGISASTFSGNTNGITEGTTNLYYTNARVYSNVIALLNAKANVTDLTTANVVETATGLYYTNNRVLSNVQAYLTANPQSSSYANANVAAYLATYTGNISAGNVIANSFVSPTATSATLTSTGNLNITSAGTINLTASNVLASGNVIANTFIATGTGSAELSTSSNLLLSATGNLNLTSSTVYVNANLILRGSLSGVTTSNIAEGSNLYYTNARVASNVIALLATLAGNNIIIAANGQISANLLAAGGGAASSVLATGVIGLNTANVNEFGSNLYYTNARVLSNVQAYLTANPQGGSYANANVAAYLATYTGNITAGNIISNSFVSPSATSATLTSTGNLNITSSGTINLTTTNVLVSGNVIANTFIATGSGAAELSTSSNLLLSATGNLNLTSGNIYINSPITFRSTVTGISSASVTQANLTTANVVEIASSGNLYYTNARVYSNVIALLNAKANVTDLTTANVTETASGLYYTNARVYSNVITLLTAKANVVDLTTANVTETASGLYYTNARVASNVIALLPTLAGDNIIIAANGRISANVSGASSTPVSANTQQFVATEGQTSFTLSSSVDSTDKIILSIDGLVQIPETGYTVSGTALTITGPVAGNSNVVVRVLSGSGSGSSSSSGGVSNARVVGYSLIFGG